MYPRHTTAFPGGARKEPPKMKKQSSRKRMAALLASTAVVAAACGADTVTDVAADAADDATEVVEEAMEDEEEAMEDEEEAGDVPATIVDLAASNDDFSTLVAAVTEAGLVETLSGEGPYTVFAPTNAAFEQALADLDLTAEELLASPDLTNILTFHVVAAEINAEAAIAADGTSVETVQGGSIDVAVVDGAVVLNDTATVTTVDLVAGNGIVHVIDAVLLP